MRWTINLIAGVVFALAFAWAVAPGAGDRHTPSSNTPDTAQNAIGGAMEASGAGDRAPDPTAERTGRAALGPQAPRGLLVVCRGAPLERFEPPFARLRTHQSVVKAVKADHELTLAAQPDGDGWRIGYGHRATASEGARITAVEAERLLQADLATREAVIRTLVRVPLNINEFSALVHLLHTGGAAAFADSALLSRLNLGDRATARAQFAAFAANRADLGVLRARQQAFFACQGRARYAL